MIKCDNCGKAAEQGFFTAKGVPSKWCDRCRETRRNAVYKHKKKKHGTLTNAVRQHKYGMSPLQMADLKNVNACDICSLPIEGIRLHVDHCHKLNKVRGFLCPSCNTGIGKFLENPELIRKAADYVERGGRYEINGQEAAAHT